ncbi:M20 family metallopeptidase [Alloiococcus sp. CFN-8]|uniref:M20 family metallopeptidase n=1 Tax=Alloiococcus sp. CFN-8 TaxID=3416081 RepID=UPI003CF6AAD3
MNYLERAQKLKTELISFRRYFHKNPEIEMNLPKTTEFVMSTLKEMGYEPKKICESTITASVGKGNGKVILLRADMDALPMKEDSGLDFASTNGYCHACGHDLHTSMLLGAAKMLKENEENIEGTVKLLFQAGEEVFQGSKAAIKAGILENPKVDAALGYHVGAGKMPVGIYMYNSENTMMFSNDGFKITVKGIGAHGAYPQYSIDSINIAAHIYIGLQELIAREVDPTDTCVLTIGSFNAGTAPNIIPETAILQGTIRTASTKTREQLVKRMKEVSKLTAETYRGTAEVEMISEVPPLICNPEFTNEIVKYMQELPLEGLMGYPKIQASASDDFAEILNRVPGAYMYLAAGFPNDEINYQAHTPNVRFNEDVLPFGAAALAHSATQWLKSHKD